MSGLTRRQKEIIDFIRAFIKKEGYSPSYREIMSHFGFTSLGSVAGHIRVLKRKGVLRSEDGCSRSLIPVETESPSHETTTELSLPFIGYISAGAPIETFPQAQSIAVPQYLVQSPENTYILRARGDSLHDELITDGDLLLVRASQEAEPGDHVLALVNRGDALVKRYFPEGNHVYLKSAQPHLPPISLRHDELLIQGVLVGLTRIFS